MAGNFFANCLLCTGGVCMGGCVILLVSAFPVAQIALGAVYIDECPAAPAIPVYLMVSGVVALLLMLMNMGLKLVCPTERGGAVGILLTIVVALFAFVWFIFGSYHIYSIYPPNYTKIDMDPNSLNSSISTPTAPDNKTSLTSENQNQSTPNLNRTWMINKNNNNQTLMNLTETLARVNIINNKRNLTETLSRVNINNKRNLTETLARVNINNKRNLTETLARVNINNKRNLTETLARVNINNKRNLTETLARVNISNWRNLTETLARVNINNKRNLTETLARVNINNKRNLTETLDRVNISSEANREHLSAPQTRQVATASSYCQRTMYLFAFWSTTLGCVLVGLSLVMAICIFGFLIIADMLTKHLF